MLAGRGPPVGHCRAHVVAELARPQGAHARQLHPPGSRMGHVSTNGALAQSEKDSKAGEPKKLKPVRDLER